MSNDQIIKKLEKSERRISLIDDNKSAKRELKTLKSARKGEIDNLQIPQISIKPFSIKPLTELDTNVSIVKTKKEHLKIPQFNLANFTMSKITNLDTAILIEQHETDKKLAVPQLKIKTFNPISTCSDLDTEFEITVERPPIKLPQLLLTRFKQIQPYERFLIDKPVQLESHPKVTPEERVKGETAEFTAESSSESEEYELFEEIDFVEFILGKGSGKILSGKPLCIIVEKHPDKYEHIVEAICKEVYRERRGGYLQPIRVKTVDEIEFELKAEISDQIILVEQAKYSEILKKVLSKLPKIRDSLGFLILVTDKPEELEIMIRKNIPTAEEYLIRIEPTKLDENLKIRIVEFIKGQKLLKSYSFGEDFMKAVSEFEKVLLKFLDYNKAPNELKVMWHKLMAKSPESPEQASEEHSAMKSFVWQYLWKKYRKIPKLEDERGVDVSIDNENYEIETLYGCGDPIAKLTEKMEKFTRNDKIFFVLRNISILMHLKELISFKKTWNDLGYNVEIVGIDFERKDLITIRSAKTIIDAKTKPH